MTGRGRSLLSPAIRNKVGEGDRDRTEEEMLLKLSGMGLCRQGTREREAQEREDAATESCPGKCEHLLFSLH